MIITVLIFFLMLSVLVLIHELGHFIAAKKFGIKVEEFGLGLPPRIFGVKRGETIYSINWLPIGGFVKLFGEEGEEMVKGKKAPVSEVKRAFYARPAWQRGIVLLAGVTMNFLLAFVIITYLFNQGIMLPTDRVHIELVQEDSPAAVAGLSKGDVIKQINVSNPSIGLNETVDIKKTEDLQKITKEHLGEVVMLMVERDSVQLQIPVTLRSEVSDNQGAIGINISNYEEKSYPLWEAPFVGMRESLNLSWLLIQGIGMTLWKLISFQSVSRDVAGPLGMAQMTDRAVKVGYKAVLELIGLFSLNLAIVNALPFPALDGGRFLFVIIEGLTGYKIKLHWERHIHQIGMAILLSLMVLVTLNDLFKLFVH